MVSSCALLWLGEKKRDIISVFLYLLRLVLWPSLWSILEHISMWTWKECAFCCFGMECPIYTYVMYIWSSVSFKTTVSLLIFHLYESVPWCKWSVKLSYHFSIIVNFLFLCLLIFVFHKFSCSYMGCMYECYILFLKIDHYIIIYIYNALCFLFMDFPLSLICKM